MKLKNTKPNLNIVALQWDLHWHDPSKNFDYIESYLENSEVHYDLMVLPEMFNTGFSMETDQTAEPMDGYSILQMRRIAYQKHIYLAGSLAIEEAGKIYNRLVLVSPQGEIQSYDKKHLFTPAREHKSLSSGKRRVVWDIQGWKLMPLICYDLRFPVWSRNNVNYDALLYVASWPSKRHDAWVKLLAARAIENQCFVIGCNRTGTDPQGFKYWGGTKIIDFNGQTLADAGYLPGVAQQVVEYDSLRKFRRKLPFLKDMDDFELYSDPR